MGCWGYGPFSNDEVLNDLEDTQILDISLVHWKEH